MLTMWSKSHAVGVLASRILMQQRLADRARPAELKDGNLEQSMCETWR